MINLYLARRTYASPRAVSATQPRRQDSNNSFSSNHFDINGRKVVLRKKLVEFDRILGFRYSTGVTVSAALLRDARSSNI